MRLLYVFLVITIIGCNNTSDILPHTETIYVEDYLCPPHRVTVYEVEGIKIDDLFYTYPTQEFCSQRSEFSNTTWVNWNDYEDPTKSKFMSYYNRYDKLNDLFKQLEDGDVYFGSCFRYFLNAEEERYKRHDKMAFLDTKSKRLYVFEDISW